jgi:hypothetical protein
MEDLTGKKFGKLKVLSRSDKFTPGLGRKWVCRCSCGRICEKRTSQLNNGVQSCGCFRSQALKQRHRQGLIKYRGPVKHGGRKLPEYQIWVGMIRRCEDRNRDEYVRYGGAGITVCDQWRESFSGFLRDMGSRPSPSHTLERKDNTLGYSPSNCVWDTRKNQTKNRSNTILVTYNGRTASLAEWSDLTGISLSCLYQRHARGWTSEKLLQTPPQRRTGNTANAATGTGSTK